MIEFMDIFHNSLICATETLILTYRENMSKRHHFYTNEEQLVNLAFN